MDENLTKGISDLTGLLSKLAGPLADEVGQIIGDKAREYRISNAIKIFQRVQRMVLEAKITPQAIPPRLFLPAFDAASIEDNESLQERWAALLANASDPVQSVSVLRSFVEVLKELNPEQATFLDEILKCVTMNGKIRPHITHAGIKIGDFNHLLQLFGVDRNPQQIFGDEHFREHVVSRVDDLVRLGIINRVLFDEQTLRNIGSQVSNLRSVNEIPKLFKADTGFYLTSFGLSFIQACTAPISHERTPPAKPSDQSHG